MLKKSLSLALLLSLFFVTFVVATSFEGTPLPSCQASSSLVYVDAQNTDGPWIGSSEFPFISIQQAVENVSSKTTLFVRNGRYVDHVVVDKELTIIGENKEKTVIDGNNQSVLFDIVHSNVTIQNLTLQNSGGNKGDAAITCDADDFMVSDCVFFRTKTGIFINDTSRTSISHCFFYGNGDGIHVKHAKDGMILNNMFTHNSFGMVIVDSQEFIIEFNDATVNGIGLYGENSKNLTIRHCAMYNNNDNQGGIFLEQCHHIKIDDSNIYHNGFGIKTEQCTDVNISYCSITYNTHAGFFIKKQSSDIFISNCEIAHNLRINIYARYSDFTQIKSNNYDTICTVYGMHADADMRKTWWGASFPPLPFQITPFSYYYADESSLLFSPSSSDRYEKVGASWDINQSRCIIPDYLVTPVVISFDSLDTDDDGVPDEWEIQYGYDPQTWDNHSQLDPDEDGLNNIQECYAQQWGAHPFQKDVFWELDWMKTTHDGVTNKPDANLIAEIQNSFAAHNITLHVDTGNLGGGEQVPYRDSFSIVDLRDYYWEYFLDNDITNPRKGIFHYGFLCDSGPSAGNAFFGWDHLDSFIVSADKIGKKIPLMTRERILVGGAVHELGHTLALTVDDHGGNDNIPATIPFTKEWLTYLPYRSCMNYWHTYKILSFSDGSHGKTDFDDWAHMDLSFFKDTHFTLPDEYR